MNEYGAIIADGLPDDLGQSGSGVLADESLQTAYQFQWRLVNGRLIVEVGQEIDTAHVALFRGDGRRNA
jgi:hypothetical protein